MVPNSPDSKKEILLSGRVDERKSRLLVEIHGDVICTQVQGLRRELAALIESSDTSLWKSLYLDIRTARIIDCMGVNWVYTETIRLRDSAKSVVIRISSPAINRIFLFVGIDKLALIKFRRRKQTR